MAYDIGFLGGGQLARMSIQAAQRMGLTCIALDPAEDCPASQIADSIVGRLDDVKAIAQIFDAADRVTLENEFIPAELIRQAIELAEREEEDVLPGIATLAAIQDKLVQRQALRSAGVPSPKAIPMTDAAEAIRQIGLPMVLKARFGGYDGKGTRYAHSPEDIEKYRPLWEGGGWLAEEFVTFKRELAVMVYVSELDSGCFPTMETIQTDHVCDLVFPSDADGSEIALAAIRAVEGYGLFGVELFQLADGELLVNEIAPRPHNSGHYTLDWGGTSQFEQHVRLVMEMPLGRAEGTRVCMANLLGQPKTGDFRDVLASFEDRDTHFHWYGKAESREGRKMGHLNIRALPNESNAYLIDRARRIRHDFYRAWANGA